MLTLRGIVVVECEGSIDLARMNMMNKSTDNRTLLANLTCFQQEQKH